MPHIHIADWPEPVKVGRGSSILESALDAGVPFPHGCGSGECGSCKCRLIDGEVASDRWSPDALSDEEHASGLILACRSRPIGDVSVKWLSASAVSPMVKLAANIASIARVSHDVVVLTVELRDDKRLNFRPGQFAKLRFNKLPARSYSMANQPGQGQLVFHIRIVPDGKVSGAVATDMRPGDPVEVRGPFGDAYWDGVVDSPLLLLAGGTGLAPILSVLDAALRDGQRADHIHLYHGVRTERDLYASSLLEQRAQEHGIRFVPVYAEGRGAATRNGHLHEAVAGDFRDLASSLIHVAGPPPMVAAVTDLAVNRGAQRERIRADAFHAAEPEKRGLWERVTGWGGITGWGGLN
jgi:naphthalene 1,2-dioxygenase ferredoxin reductase component